MWFRILLTASALAVVLYFQFFFDFKSYTKEIAQANDESAQAQK